LSIFARYWATSTGKTFIAAHLLKRIADAGQLRRALFVCDRDELRSQGLGAPQNVFGADAAVVLRISQDDRFRVISVCAAPGRGLLRMTPLILDADYRRAAPRSTDLSARSFAGGKRCLFS